MASGRILKCQISLSEQVNDLSLRSALLFTWMITHADDFGRMRGSSRKVKAQVVPMRDDFTTQQVDDCLNEMCSAGLIQRYEIEGEFYIQFPSWEEHQSGLHKRTRSKIPEKPPGDETKIPGISGNFRAELEQNRTELELEQKGTEQESIVPSGTTKKAKPEFSDEFETAWAMYPKRSGADSKADAFKQWRARLKSGESSADMLAGVVRYQKFCDASGKSGTEYVMQAKRFFGAARHYAEAWTYTPPPSKQELVQRRNASEVERWLNGGAAVFNDMGALT